MVGTTSTPMTESWTEWLPSRSFLDTLQAELARLRYLRILDPPLRANVEISPEGAGRVLPS